MLVAVPEISVDLMSRDGLTAVVRFLVRGLRDMDAILGRDDRLVEKIGKACEKLSADFIAVIGTPVPAVIGTDYKALSRMIEKKTGIPALTIDTDGTKLYDIGEKKTWKELFKKFAVKQEVEPGRVGIIGATPAFIWWHL